MKPFFMALAVLCVVSCAKPSKNDVSPSQEQGNNSGNNNTPLPSDGSESFPFSFLPDEPVTGYVVTLEQNSSISDYSSIIKAKLTEIVNNGGGTLVVPYGEYPLKSEMVFAKHDGGPFSIAIVGQRGPNGEFPVFHDKDVSHPPHQFFQFQSNWNTPQMTFSVRNLVFEGNNQPYSGSHPFYGAGATPTPCISGRNIHSASIKNVVIKNVYGDGLFFVNGAQQGKDVRIESVEIMSCKIINCWSDNLQNWNGDGIMLWGCNNPVVKGCIISNNIDVTHYYSRCGIVLEHGTEKATIQNNFIEGYRKNIHIECDYGGHLITNNKIYRDSKVGIIFSEDCQQDPSTAADYAPSKILNNEFVYDQTYGEYSANHATFIYIYKKSFTLNGLEIKGNKFSFKEKNSPSDRAQYVNTTHPFNVYIQTFDQEDVTIANNIYE